MIIASRTLKLRQEYGDTDIAERIYAPRSDGDSWVCSYEIDWPEGTRNSFAGGFDSVQSLHLALTKIGVEIYTSDYHKSGHLAWGEPGKGYGFPVTQNLRDLLIGDDAKYF
jgi:hypothetical protein